MSFRGAVAGLIAALLASPLVACTNDDSGSSFEAAGPVHQRYAQADRGEAFQAPGEVGSAGPQRPGSFGLFGLVSLVNVAEDDVRLVAAEPVWVDPTLTVSRMAVGPGNAGAASGVNEHAASVVPLGDYPPITRSRGSEDYHTVSFEVVLDEGAREGLVLGLDVFYEQDGRLRFQRWPMVVGVCRWEGEVPAPCTFRGRPSTDLRFEPLLREVRSEAGSGGSR